MSDPELIDLGPADHRGKQLGALDLGSNSFHLLVAQQSHGRIQILDKHKEMVRLAEGLNEDNELSETAIKRALECLERSAQRLRSLDSDNVRVVGTNTLRKASNAKSFIRRAEETLGHRIEIISGREEARLIFLGVCHDLGGEDIQRLIVDIGGGSTELILGRKAIPDQLESLYMGCVSMTKRHFKDGKITAGNFAHAIEDALVELAPVSRAFVDRGWDIAVGASGTINAVFDVLCGHTDHNEITSKGLSQLRDQMIQSGHVDNLELPGLAEERKVVFAGGVAILSGIFSALQIKSMTAAQSALREGLIYDLLGRQQEDDARNNTVHSLIKRYRIDTRHARQVRESAIALLSQVAMAWELTEPAHQHLIAWAADLHEIGMDISHSGFHKHSSYLLENMDMPGFSRSEQQQLATLVRAHRRKLNKVMFADTDVRVIRLVVLLRVAVLLHRNRSHDSLPHINAQAGKNKLTLSIPGQWLEEHPLTAVDLENEARYLSAVDMQLCVKRH